MKPFFKCLLLLPFFCLGQQNSYIYWKDTLEPLMNENYLEARDIFTDSNRDKFNPQIRYSILKYALKNLDFVLFEQEAKELMLEYGWRYSPKDTLKVFGIHDDIEAYGFREKLISWSDSLFPIWLKNHPRSADIYLSCVPRSINEPNRVIFYPSDSLDSIWYNHRMANNHWNQALELYVICVSLQGLPNEFEHGFGVSNAIYSFMSTVLSSSENFQKIWDLFKPFIEKTYKEGKISQNLFRLYDIKLIHHSGMQYYGFFGDKYPCGDVSAMLERQKELNLYFTRRPLQYK